MNQSKKKYDDVEIENALNNQRYNIKIDNKIYDQLNYGELIFEKVLYNNCEFRNITFKNISFNKTYYLKCTFINCTFKKCKTEYFGLLIFMDTHLFRCNFNKCNFYQACFLHCFLELIQYKNSNLLGSIFDNCAFMKVIFIGKCNISGTSFIDPNSWMDINFVNINDIICNTTIKIKGFNYKCKMKQYIDTEYFFDGSFEVKKTDQIAKTYMNFAELLKKNNFFKEYSFCFYYSNKQKHKNLKGFNKVKSSINLITCGYGDKPHYGIITALVYIVMNSFIYMTGVVWKGELIQYNLTISKEGFQFSLLKFSDWLKCLYFSMTTYTTVGYGDSQAIGLVSRAFSFAEMFIGVLLTAIIAGTILRKLIMQS